jgi:hypothetical protein
MVMDKDGLIKMLLAIAVLVVLWFGMDRVVKTVRKSFIEETGEMMFQKNIEIANSILSKRK